MCSGVAPCEKPQLHQAWSSWKSSLKKKDKPLPHRTYRFRIGRYNTASDGTVGAGRWKTEVVFMHQSLLPSPFVLWKPSSPPQKCDLVKATCDKLPQAGGWIKFLQDPAQEMTISAHTGTFWANTAPHNLLTSTCCALKALICLPPGKGNPR